MAYGRVNVGGSSGLKCDIKVINGILPKGELSQIVTVPKYDKNKTIFLITSSGTSYFERDIRIKIVPQTDTTINLIRRSGICEVKYTIQMLQLEGFKTLHQFDREELFTGMSYTIQITEYGKKMNKNKCLIFKTYNINEATSTSSLTCIREEIIDNIYGGSSIDIDMSGTTTSHDYTVSAYYYILELK